MGVFGVFQKIRFTRGVRCHSGPPVPTPRGVCIIGLKQKGCWSSFRLAPCKLPSNTHPLPTCLHAALPDWCYMIQQIMSCRMCTCMWLRLRLPTAAQISSPRTRPAARRDQMSVVSHGAWQIARSQCSCLGGQTGARVRSWPCMDCTATSLNLELSWRRPWTGPRTNWAQWLWAT